MEQRIQITLTHEERMFINKVFDVVATFMLSLHGNMGTVADANNVKFILDNPDEFERILKKINLDRLG